LRHFLEYLVTSTKHFWSHGSLLVTSARARARKKTFARARWATDATRQATATPVVALSAIVKLQSSLIRKVLYLEYRVNKNLRMFCERFF
jgi:hypothetical protein